MSAVHVMKLTASGQISLPATVRRTWSVDQVMVIETPFGLVVRPYDPDPATTLSGKYRGAVAPSVDEILRIERAEEAEREARRR